MQQRSRRALWEGPRPRSERGSSLVEVLVAGILLGVVALGSVGVLVSTDRSVARSDQQSQASRLAASELDALRGIAYGELGTSPDAVGFVASFEGSPTVVESTNRVAPRSTVDRDGITYGINRYVTWQAVGGVERAYKKVTIVITWGQSQSFRLDGGFREVGSGG